MFRNPFLYAALLLLLAATGRLWAAEEQKLVHFTLFLKTDAVLRLDSREKRLNIQRSAFDIVSYKKEGDSFREVDRMEWPEITREIYSIDFINANRATYSKARLLLTRQDDTQEVIEYGSLYYTDGHLVDEFYYSEYNRVSGRWTRMRVPIESVKKIVMGTTELKINPETGTLYPPTYRFDPRTGAPLAESGLKED